jgi:hypothetical protein
MPLVQKGNRPKHHFPTSRAAYHEHIFPLTPFHPLHPSNRCRMRPKRPYHHFKLLNLPRDIIYHFLWDATSNNLFFSSHRAAPSSDPSSQNPSGAEFLVFSEYSSERKYSPVELNRHSKFCLRCGPRRSKPPRWIWTCKRIFVEATEQYSLPTQFTLVRWGIGGTREITQSSDDEPQPQSSSSPYAYSFLHISSARTFAVSLHEEGPWWSKTEDINAGVKWFLE